jgi:amino acid permease
MLILGGLAAEWSLSILVHCACSHKILNFSGITEAAGGPRLTALLSYSIFVFMFVSCISY